MEVGVLVLAPIVPSAIWGPWFLVWFLVQPILHRERIVGSLLLVSETLRDVYFIETYRAAGSSLRNGSLVYRRWRRLRLFLGGLRHVERWYTMPLRRLDVEWRGVSVWLLFGAP